MRARMDLEQRPVFLTASRRRMTAGDTKGWIVVYVDETHGHIRNEQWWFCNTLNAMRLLCGFRLLRLVRQLAGDTIKCRLYMQRSTRSEFALAQQKIDDDERHLRARKHDYDAEIQSEANG
jgi:hypothetical protein